MQVKCWRIGSQSKWNPCPTPTSQRLIRDRWIFNVILHTTVYPSPLREQRFTVTVYFPFLGKSLPTSILLNVNVRLPLIWGAGFTIECSASFDMCLFPLFREQLLAFGKNKRLWVLIDSTLVEFWAPHLHRWSEDHSFGMTGPQTSLWTAVV